MTRKLRLPSPAMVVALIALFLGLTGTAVAGGIVAKARYALNSGKLQGNTAAQVAQMPSPASTAASLVNVRSASYSLGGRDGRDYPASCEAGEKAVAGGYSTNGNVLGWDSRPTSENTWTVYLSNFETSGAAATVWVVCLK